MSTGKNRRTGTLFPGAAEALPLIFERTSGIKDIPPMATNEAGNISEGWPTPNFIPSGYGDRGCSSWAIVAF
jgi:hypothetical protein